MARLVSSGDSWSVAGATTFLKGEECDEVDPLVRLSVTFGRAHCPFWEIPLPFLTSLYCFISVLLILIS